MTHTKKNHTTPYPFRMTDDLKRWVQQRAKRNDRSMNAEMNRLLRQMKEAEETA